MKISRPLWVVVFMLGSWYSLPAPSFGCVVCHEDQTCPDEPTGFSGNCQCDIQVRTHFAICKPSGVCDPNDPNTCSANKDPRPKIVSRAMTVSPLVLDRLADQHRLLGIALIGASQSEVDPSGATLRTVLAEGHSTGTFTPKPNGHHYSFEVDLVGVEADSLTFTAAIKDYGTQKVLIFDGEMRQHGAQGRAVERHLGRKAGGEVRWNLEDASDPQ